MAEILIVDENEQIIQAFQRVFEKAGNQVITAKNGLEAKQLLGLFEFDLIITDIKMPYLDGLELIKFMKESEINTHIVVVSSKSDERTKIECYNLGVENFFQKPISPTELIARILYLIRDEDAQD